MLNVTVIITVTFNIIGKDKGLGSLIQPCLLTNFQGRGMDLVECLSFLFQISFATLGKVLL